MEIPFEPSSSFCYRFARYKAIPEILLEPEVASGEKFRLIEFVRAVIDRHLTAEQQTQTFKKARSEGYDSIGKAIKFYIPFIAKETGQLISVGGGWFRLPSADDISEDEIEEAVLESAALQEDGGEADELSGTVYAFTFPLLMKVGAPFPIKVGMAAGDVDKRVALQCRQSASFDNPVILGRWPAKRVRALEQAIHNILRARGKWRENVPGIEWFDTTLDEIESIVQFVQAADRVQA